MKVLLVDDHPLFLEGLSNLLTVNGIDVIGTAVCGLEAIRMAEILQPDVILMDVQMPNGDGIEATRRIKTAYPQIKIVMLTVSQDDIHLFEAVKAGASGYLLKGLPKEKFLSLLQGISQGEAPLAPGVAAKLLEEFALRENQRDASDSVNKTLKALLNPRQIEILQWVAQGLTYKEVADKLDLTEAAIKYHMGEIINRLHLENRSQAVAYATQIGLIQTVNKGQY